MQFLLFRYPNESHFDLLLPPTFPTFPNSAPFLPYLALSFFPILWFPCPFRLILTPSAHQIAIMATRKCAAVVVGAGPAGVAVVGNLLERQLGTIAWIDPSFESGRVNRKYCEVPRLVVPVFFSRFSLQAQD